MVRRWHLLGAAVVALSLTAGCGGGGDDASPAAPEEGTSTTTAAPPPPSTAASEEDAVLAAYQGYWDTWLAANDPPNPDHPDLERYATGAALTRDKEAISGHRQLGERLRLPANSVSEHRPEVVRIGDRTAVIVDCSVDDGLVVANGSDFVLDDTIVTWTYEAELVWEASWKVQSLRVINRTEGVSGCAD